MEINEFENRLSDLIGRPTNLRPFVCEGSPLDCDVFICGVNPATGMNLGFWDFWVPGRGYDKARWYEQYKVERTQKPLRSGKTRRPEVSPTRRNTNSFVAGAAPSRVMETNLDPRPTENANHLKRWSDLRVEVFEFLFATIKPRAVLFHGKFAEKAVERYGADTTARAEHHLSFQTSNEKTWGYGARAAQESRSRL